MKNMSQIGFIFPRPSRLRSNWCYFRKHYIQLLSSKVAWCQNEAVYDRIGRISTAVGIFPWLATPEIWKLQGGGCGSCLAVECCCGWRGQLQGAGGSSLCGGCRERRAGHTSGDCARPSHTENNEIVCVP